jgi:hypothetical protein
VITLAGINGVPIFPEDPPYEKRGLIFLTLIAGIYFINCTIRVKCMAVKIGWPLCTTVMAVVVCGVASPSSSKCIRK